MAIPLNPARSRIADEFGTDTLASVTSNRSLSAMYNHIRVNTGQSLPSDFSRNALSGFGRPVLSSFSAGTGTLGGNVSFVIGLSSFTNMDTASATIQYSEDVENPDPTTINDWTTLLSGISLTSTGNNNVDDVEMPDPNTEYIFRVLYFNAFNSASLSDHDEFGTYPTATSSNLPTLATPVITDVESLGAGEYKIIWTTSGTPPTNFLFRFNIDGGSFDSDNTFSSSGRVNWGSTSNPKEGIVQLAAIPNPEDEVGFGVKGQRDVYNDSVYSDTFFVEPEAEPQPTATQPTVQSITANSATFRITLSDVSGQGFTARYRWRYRPIGSSNQFTHTQSGAPSTTSDGTYTFNQTGLSAGTDYEVWGQAWNEDDVGGTVETNRRTFTTSQLSPNPTNVTLTGSGSSKTVSWTTPERGNPNSYSINITVDGGSPQNIVSGLSGASTSHNFNVCNFAGANDNYVVTVIAIYSDDSGSGTASDSVGSFECF